MSEIRLEDGTINVDGTWLSTADLKQRIQDEIQNGDMKITALAAALDELNAAVKNSQPIEVKLVLSRTDYERLKNYGGEDDRESIRKAIYDYIKSPASKHTQKQVSIKCPQCGSVIDVLPDKRPAVIECQHCGTSGRLTENNKWAKLDSA